MDDNSADDAIMSSSPSRRLRSAAPPPPGDELSAKERWAKATTSLRTARDQIRHCVVHRGRVAKAGSTHDLGPRASVRSLKEYIKECLEGVRSALKALERAGSSITSAVETLLANAAEQANNREADRNAIEELRQNRHIDAEAISQLKHSRRIDLDAINELKRDRRAGRDAIEALERERAVHIQRIEDMDKLLKMVAGLLAGVRAGQGDEGDVIGKLRDLAEGGDHDGHDLATMMNPLIRRRDSVVLHRIATIEPTPSVCALSLASQTEPPQDQHADAVIE